MKRSVPFSGFLAAIVLILAPKPALGQEPAQPSLRLASPREGEKWCRDSLHYLAWEAPGVAREALVKIEYKGAAGTSWQELATTPNSGRFLWKVSRNLPEKCLVRISTQQPRLTAQAALAIIPSQEVHDYEWVLVTRKAAFAPRDGAGALVFNGRMWLLGGWNPGDKKFFPRICNNEVWSSPDGADWTLVKPNSFLDRSFKSEADWEGRHTAGYAVFKDKMWIVGGDVNQGHYHFDVWNSTDGKNWTHVNQGQPVPWGPRALHYTLAFKDKLWVMGGQTIPNIAKSPEVFYRDVWNSADGVNWQRLEPREPYWSIRGMIGGSAVFQDRMWILGGGTYDTPQTRFRRFYNDVWSSADGVNWTRHVESAPWEPRQYHEIAVFDQRLWVMEGYGKKNRNDTWYSADGLNWYELPKTPWAPRHAASVFVFDNALWMVAGNNMQSDVWKLRRK